MVPLIAVAHMFPLHAEIDFGPLALRAPVVYRVRITVETATGQKVDVPLTLAADATPDDAVSLVAGGIQSVKKWAAWRQGDVIIVGGHAGSPVKKVTIEGDDPKPKFRWVSRQK